MKTKAEYIADVIFDDWEREGGMTKRRMVEILEREMAAMAPPKPLKGGKRFSKAR